MQRKLGKKYNDMVNHHCETGFEPEGCYCLTKPQESLQSFTKKTLEVLDVYLLFFGLLVIMVIGAQWTISGLFLDKLQINHICVVLLFLIFGLQLKGDDLFAGLKAYKAIIWSLLSILFVTPAIGIQITKTIHFATLSDQNITTVHSRVEANVSAIGPTEFALGLEVFFGVPASFASGAILGVIAGGNLALSLLLMVVTNMVGVFSVPPLLTWMTSIDTSDVTLKGYALLLGIFILTVVLPTMVGHALRLVPRVPECIDDHPKALRYVIIALFILSTWPVVSKAQTDDVKYSGIIAMNTIAILGFTTIMHAIFLLLNWVACGILKIHLPLKKTVVILASHKAIQFALTTIGFFPESTGSRDLMRIACIIAYLVVLGLDSLIVSKLATMEEDPLDHLFTDEETYTKLSTED